MQYVRLKDNLATASLDSGVALEWMCLKKRRLLTGYLIMNLVVPTPGEAGCFGTYSAHQNCCSCTGLIWMRKRLRLYGVVTLAGLSSVGIYRCKLQLQMKQLHFGKK